MHLSGEAEDVVTQHRQRNHAPHLPNNEQLLAIWNQQSPQVSSGASGTNDAVDILDDLESPAPDSVPCAPTSQASNNVDTSYPPLGATSTSGIMPNSNSDLSQLQHYTPLCI